MDKIKAFMRQYKTQLLYVFLGAVAVIVARYSFEALAAMIALFFGAEAHTHTKANKEKRAKLKDLQDRQAEVMADLKKVREDNQKAKTAAEQKASDEVDDYIDGGW